MNRIMDEPLKTNIYLGKIQYGTYIIKNIKFVKNGGNARKHIGCLSLK